MSTEPVQSAYVIRGTDAASVVRSIEDGVASGALRANQAMPSVRALARELGLSPTTVASAYRDLRHRGVLISHDRSRTVVAHRSPVASRLAPDLPAGVADLTDGSPDPDLLPDLGPALAAIDPRHRLYTEDVALPAMLELMRSSFAGDGIAAEHLAVVGGALDGIERVLGVHCGVGDLIAVEDPGYAASLDLIRSMGLRPLPVPVDDEGLSPDGLERALARGARAVLLVPRAQNPTGAALSEPRAQLLRSVLAEHPDALVIEDDHAGPVAGAAHRTTIGERPRWAVVRSVAKSLGPDLRLAMLTGDEHTVSRLMGRQRLGPGWVSRILQGLVATVEQQAADDGTIDLAQRTYARRRQALARALEAAGQSCSSASGLNVWIPVPEEVPVVQGMAARGWGVQAGEPYRIEAPPGIRITIARLPEEDAGRCADDLVATLRGRSTRRG